MADTATLRSAVQGTLDALDGVELEPQLKEVAFQELLRHLLSGSPNVRPRNGNPSLVGTPTGAFAESEQERAAALAGYLGVGLDDVDTVFDLSGEDPTLSVRSVKLDPAKARATGQIALLVCAARTALGTECTADHIREVADQYGKYDAANFMTTLGVAHGLTLKGTRGSPRRTVRLTVPGKEEAADLVGELSKA